LWWCGGFGWYGGYVSFILFDFVGGVVVGCVVFEGIVLFVIGFCFFWVGFGGCGEVVGFV